MPNITAITPQIKDKTRCNIEVDGRFFCGMKLETVLQNHLKAGLAVTYEELAAIQLESEKMTALDKALSYISVSMKTEKQIRDYLARKGYVEDVIAFVLGKMREYGYIDDAAFSASYAESAGKRKGRRLIAAELRGKGVSDETIRTALDGLEGEKESAVRLLEKYLRGKTSDKTTLQKGYRYLIGKGFDYETARDAFKTLGETCEDE